MISVILYILPIVSPIPTFDKPLRTSWTVVMIAHLKGLQPVVGFLLL